MLNKIRKRLIILLAGDLAVCINFDLKKCKESEAVAHFDNDDDYIFAACNIEISDVYVDYQMTPTKTTN